MAITANKVKNDQLFHMIPTSIMIAKTMADNALTLKTEKLNAITYLNFIQYTTIRPICLIQWY